VFNVLCARREVQAWLTWDVTVLSVSPVAEKVRVQQRGVG